MKLPMIKALLLIGIITTAVFAEEEVRPLTNYEKVIRIIAAAHDDCHFRYAQNRSIEPRVEVTLQCVSNNLQQMVDSGDFAPKEADIEGDNDGRAHP